MGKKRTGFMSSKIGDLFGEDPAPETTRPKGSSLSSSMSPSSQQVVDARMDKEFKSHFREVLAVGTTGLGKRQKWEMKCRDVDETGRLQKKNIKTPYNILINSKKKKKVMEEKRTQKLREMGLASKIIDGKASNKTGAQRSRNRTINDGTRGINETIGSYHRGTLHISKADVAKIKGKKGGNGGGEKRSGGGGSKGKGKGKAKKSYKRHK